jgi:hypothetical protein
MVRTIWFVFVLALAFAQQGPAPGNPDHKEPPAGWWCRNYFNDPPAHKCECERMCKINTDGTIEATEDPKCRAYCFKSFCRCVSESCDGHH